MAQASGSGEVSAASSDWPARRAAAPRPDPEHRQRDHPDRARAERRTRSGSRSGRRRSSTARRARRPTCAAGTRCAIPSRRWRGRAPRSADRARPPPRRGRERRSARSETPPRRPPIAPASATRDPTNGPKRNPAPIVMSTAGSMSTRHAGVRRGIENETDGRRDPRSTRRNPRATPRAEEARPAARSATTAPPARTQRSVVLRRMDAGSSQKVLGAIHRARRNQFPGLRSRNRIRELLGDFRQARRARRPSKRVVSSRNRARSRVARVLLSCAVVRLSSNIRVPPPLAREGVRDGSKMKSPASRRGFLYLRTRTFGHPFRFIGLAS